MRYLLLVLLLAAPLAARRVEFINLGAPEHRAARLQSQVEAAFDHVAQKTGLDDRLDLQLTLVGAARQFSELAQADGVSMDSESVLGYAVPARRRIVLNLSAMLERELEPLGVLRHEIAHLVMGSQLQSHRPLWFEEGVANYVENMALNALREGTQVSLSPPDFLTLDELSQGLRNENAGFAYPESRRVVQLIATQWGEAKLKALLAALQEPGVDFAAAFSQSTGQELSVLQDLWQRQRQEEAKGRFVAWLGANWSWLLFAMGAVIMLAGVWVVRRRGKQQVDTWEEQEKYFPSDPSWSYSQHDPGDFGYDSDANDDDQIGSPRG